MISLKLTLKVKLRWIIYLSFLLCMAMTSYWYSSHSVVVVHDLYHHHPQQQQQQQQSEWTTIKSTQQQQQERSTSSTTSTTMIAVLPPSTTTTTTAAVQRPTILMAATEVVHTQAVPINNIDESNNDNTTTDNIDIHFNTVETGILSSMKPTYFQSIQTDIDDVNDHMARCRRYNYNSTTVQRRRIFYGTLIADETMELLHIIATETYQLYTGMVFVESNRTQSFVHTRPWKHVISDDTDTDDNNNSVPRNRRQQKMATLFGISNSDQVLIKPFINEDKTLRSLYREQQQRNVIIEGWKQLGMQPHDIGIIADLDETFSRDYLLAIQTCSDIPQFQYHHHYCHHESVKITARARVYESSPQCLTEDRLWYHPDIIIGHCIEGIGNAQQHPPAPRENDYSFIRAPGFGQDCDDWYNESKVINHQYPTWSAADFRRTCSGLPQQQQPEYHTAYHFHNFFMSMNATRYKYLSYGHADRYVHQKPIYEISNDLQMMYQCVMDLPDDANQKWKRTIMDDDIDNNNASTTTKYPLMEPIYFMDQDYRQRRHAHVRTIVEADDEQLKSHQFLRSESHEPTDIDTKHTPQPIFDVYNDVDESIHATVMAMATNYDLWTYKRFVGSLRYSGYKGHIIVALQPNPKPKIVNYLLEKNVTIKLLSWVNCTYLTTIDEEKETDNIFQQTSCADPYPDIKIRWSRFPLMRDWLLECTSCTGPILIADARDLIFQRNPFDVGAPKVSGLQVYQEHINMTTKDWLTAWPIRACKNVTYNEPMLCSGTTIGTRETMLQYLDIMYEEMKVWINDPHCRFNINGDDQAIHNYIYYSGQLPSSTTISVPNRRGGIVNTIGYHASVLYRQYNIDQNITSTSTTTGLNQQQQQQQQLEGYPGATNDTWIGPSELGLTNHNGLLVELDHITISRAVHQWDRFGTPYIRWLRRQPWTRF